MTREYARILEHGYAAHIKAGQFTSIISRSIHISNVAHIQEFLDREGLLGSPGKILHLHRFVNIFLIIDIEVVCSHGFCSTGTGFAAGTTGLPGSAVGGSILGHESATATTD
jgi:hypothetical protein